jgi:hypothetical protein
MLDPNEQPSHKNELKICGRRRKRKFLPSHQESVVLRFVNDFDF